MSYQLKLNPKSRFVARFMSRIQGLIQAELIESGKTQQEIADLIGVNRSVINRRLSSDANITSRSLAEFAYAFSKDIDIKFVQKGRVSLANTTEVGHPIMDKPISITSTAGTVAKKNDSHYVSRSTL